MFLVYTSCSTVCGYCCLILLFMMGHTISIGDISADLVQNEAWHCPAEIDMEFLGKVIVFTAAYVSLIVNSLDGLFHLWHIESHIRFSSVSTDIALFGAAGQRAVYAAKPSKLNATCHILRCKHFLLKSVYLFLHLRSHSPACLTCHIAATSYSKFGEIILVCTSLGT